MYILNRLFYYGFIVPLSSLPFSVLYFISDGLYILLYYLVGYRKQVVMGNLAKSFPALSTEERKIIAKKFYRHFCDLIVESLKVFTISSEEANNCITYKNVDLPDSYFDNGRSILIVSGHYGNWELAAVTYDAATKHQAVGIYTPLTNKYFDGKMLQSRQKYGIRMIPNRKVKEVFEELKNELTATVLLIDQSPSPHSKVHWMEFLGQDTAVLTGTERLAVEHNYPVIYLHLTRLSRGRYELTFELVTDTPRETSPGEITEKVTRVLEQVIRRVPELWLWSHRRWKRARPDPVTSEKD